MAKFKLMSLQINTTGEDVSSYIQKRYPHYLEYSAYQCEHAGIPDEAVDLLNSVMLDILQKDPCKLKKLYEAKKIQKKIEYREIDWFILKTINLNAHSLNAPYRFKNKPLPVAREVNWQRLKIVEESPTVDDVEASEDKPALTLKYFRLVRWVYYGLDLTELERNVFEYVFFQAEPIPQWPGPETPKQIYVIYNQIVDIIHQILYHYDLTTVIPKSELSSRNSVYVEKFVKTHKISIKKTVNQSVSK